LDESRSLPAATLNVPMPKAPITTPNAEIIAQLLAQSDWVRRMARELVSDPFDADDLAQDTLVAAVESPPRHIRNPRAWLGTVLRNLNASRFRSTARRTAREHEAARTEAQPATDTLVERASLQRDLATRVLELDEPYRQVLLLHYFEGHSTRDIADALNRPVPTVRTQITRGLEKLRVGLDKEYGDRRAWGLALIPLFDSTGGLPPSIRLGAKPPVQLAASAPLVWGTLLVVFLVALGIPLWRGAHNQVPRTIPVSMSGDLGIRPANVTPDPLQKAASERSRVPARAAATTATFTLKGHLFDEYGGPLAGIPVRSAMGSLGQAEKMLADTKRALDNIETYTPEQQARIRAAWEDPMAMFRAENYFNMNTTWLEWLVAHERKVTPSITTDTGAWQIEMPAEFKQYHVGDSHPILEIEFDAEDLILVGGGRPLDDPEHVVLVLAPTIAISGTVLDSSGQPLTGATVGTGSGISLLRSFPIKLQNTWDGTRWRGLTTRLGGFSIPRVPGFEGNTIRVSKEGYRTVTLAVPEVATANITIRLTPVPLPPNPIVSGRVLGVDGQPLANADVVLSEVETKSDRDGRFTLELTDFNPVGISLAAGKAGLQGATIPLAKILAKPDEPVIVRLGPPSLSITGKLLSTSGGPPGEGWLVTLSDSTAMGWTLKTLEQFTVKNDSEVDEFGTVALDPTGAFHLDGLIDRDYSLRFWNRQEVATFDVRPFAAGSKGLAIRPPKNLTPVTLEGRIVNTQGDPVAFAKLSLRIDFSDDPLTRKPLALTEFKADDQGHFKVVSPSSGVAFLRAESPLTITKEWTDLAALADLKPLVLTVPFIYKFTVQLADGDPADRFQVLDADGEVLMAVIHRPGPAIRSTSVSLGEAGFPAVSVNDHATTLVLFAGETELRRIPLRPRPGPVETLAF